MNDLLACVSISPEVILNHFVLLDILVQLLDFFNDKKKVGHAFLDFLRGAVVDNVSVDRGHRSSSAVFQVFL